MKAEGKYLASMGILFSIKKLLMILMSNPNTKDFGKEITQAVGNKIPTNMKGIDGYW
jgi:glucose-1-phosphate adenylyltransferase